MNPGRLELALKKERLLMLSASQRASIASYSQPLTPLFQAADKGYAAFRWLKRHPAVPVAVLVALLVVRPRAILRWTQRGWLASQALRKALAFLSLA